MCTILLGLAAIIILPILAVAAFVAIGTFIEWLVNAFLRTFWWPNPKPEKPEHWED